MEWDLLTELVQLSNNGKTKEVNEFILKTDFEDMARLKSAAITCFEITRDNIRENKEVAEKLIAFDYDGFRESLRASFAQAMLEELQEQE